MQPVKKKLEPRESFTLILVTVAIVISTEIACAILFSFSLPTWAQGLSARACEVLHKTSDVN